MAWTVLSMGAAMAADPFVTTTPGKPGADGVVPKLAGSGPGVPGTLNALLLDDARRDASATLVVRFAGLGAPFKGGTLIPSPDLLLPFVTDGEGAVSFAGNCPAGLPGALSVWLQAWIPEPSGPLPHSASNGLRLDVP
jgi:hypothetical protein